MSIIKSFSVDEGDMFYIKHGSDSFTVIDCCLNKNNKETIVDEIKEESQNKGIQRFISTHPDEDHIAGLEYLDQEMKISNFYCVENKATKKDETSAFGRYCELRDSEKSYYLSRGCKRKWLNRTDGERGSAGINILWPVTSNQHFKKELTNAEIGESPNNISPIIRYSKDNTSFLWMGDLETRFMENIKNELKIEKTSIIFAPHHGRESGKIPNDILKQLDPDIIIIGEAPSENLNYYNGYNTITQNSAGDIIFYCDNNNIHIFVSEENYDVDFLDYEEDYEENYYGKYIGTLTKE
jgi:beta-lactamase superfamily II metal-dependent hydrolase